MFRPRPRARCGAGRATGSAWSLGVVLFVVTSLHHGDVTRSERAVFDLFNTLPNGLAPLFRALVPAGRAVGGRASSWSPPRRRPPAAGARPGVAGVLAWGSARALGEIVDAHEGFAHSLRIAAGFGGSPAAYPSVRIAIIVAVIGASAPYVTRPGAAFGWTLVALLGVSALYLGTAFPNDLFAGMVLGWTVASPVHLVFGSPGTRPTIPQITEALARSGSTPTTCASRPSSRPRRRSCSPTTTRARCASA